CEAVGGWHRWYEHRRSRRLLPLYPHDAPGGDAAAPRTKTALLGKIPGPRGWDHAVGGGVSNVPRQCRPRRHRWPTWGKPARRENFRELREWGAALAGRPAAEIRLTALALVQPSFSGKPQLQLQADTG